MGVAKDDNRSREVRQGKKLRQRSRGSCVNDRRRCVVERPEERGMCVNDKGRRAVKKAGTRGGVHKVNTWWRGRGQEEDWRSS